MDEGAVTFLDVLGWKGIWTRDDDAIAKLKYLIDSAREATPTVLAAGGELTRGLDVQIESISDTIVLFSPGAPDATLWLHGALCRIIVCASLDQKIPVRGACCFGEYKTEDRIMIGPAIDEAASWHEATDWIGVMQTPSAFLQYHPPARLPRVWVPYAPPLKIGRMDTYCVDWSWHWRVECGRDESALKKVFTEMGPLDTSIAPKYLHALAFYRKQFRVPEPA